MKKCFNCKAINKNDDIYCRNCGCKIKRNIHYIFVNIGTFIAFLWLIFVVILFITSFIVD